MAFYKQECIPCHMPIDRDLPVPHRRETFRPFSALSRALGASGLKRKLFSLPEEKLASEEYAQDRILISRTPSIRLLWETFVGRAVHRSVEGWVSQITSFLDKNPESKADGLQEKFRFCTNCGASLAAGVKFCGGCEIKL